MSRRRVYLWSELRLEVVVWNVGGEVEFPLPQRVRLDREVVDEIVVPLRQVLS